jgi:glycosyltransferase involved in cell wall biosynthesis
MNGKSSLPGTYKSVVSVRTNPFDIENRVWLHQANALASITDIQKIIRETDKRKLKLNSKVDLAFSHGLPLEQTNACEARKTILALAPSNIELSRERGRSNTLLLTSSSNPKLWASNKKAICSADGVMCPSKQSAEYLSKKYSLTDTIVIVPYGCSLPQNNVAEPPGEFAAIHVSANTSEKGQLYLVKAWQKVKQIHGFFGSLSMIGQETQMWTKYGVFCSSHTNARGKAYEDCSVYVQPSVTESFGLPVLEAMSYSRPVIVTEGAGVSELVEDGKEGFVVPIRSASVLAEKIQYFFENPKESKRMGRNARAKAEKYTWSIVEAKYQSLFKGLLRS